MVSSYNQVFEQYGENNKNLVVIGISSRPEDNQERLEEFKTNNNGKYPEIEGAKYGAEIFSGYKSILGNGYPNLCLIDPVNKKIVWHALGFKSYKDLEVMLSQKGVEKRDATSITITNSKKVPSLFSILYFNKNVLVFNVLDKASYTIALFSPQGSEIERQIYTSRSPGLQKVGFNHRNLSNGNFIVQINNGFQKVSKHITVLK